VFTAAVTVLFLLPSFSASGSADPLGPVCWGSSPQDSFADVEGDHVEALACLAGYGITEGYPDGFYRQERAASRGQWATMLARLFAASQGFTATTALPVGPSTFTDIYTNVHANNIETLSFHGLVSGYNASLFDPHSSVTRGQIATMLHATLRSRGVPTPTTTSPFGDIADSSHTVGIESLYAHGIVKGFTADTFRPEAPVSRGTAALLLVRTAQVLHNYGLWVSSLLPPPPAPAPAEDDPVLNLSIGLFYDAGGELTLLQNTEMPGGAQVNVLVRLLDRDVTDPEAKFATFNGEITYSYFSLKNNSNQCNDTVNYDTVTGVLFLTTPMTNGEATITLPGGAPATGIRCVVMAFSEVGDGAQETASVTSTPGHGAVIYVALPAV